MRQAPAPTVPEVRIRSGVPTAMLRRAVQSDVLARVLAARGVVDPAQLQLDLDRLIPPDRLDGVAAAVCSGAVRTINPIFQHQVITAKPGRWEKFSFCQKDSTKTDVPI